MNIPKFYSNYTNLLPFTIEILVEASPVTPDEKPIEFFIKKKIARVHYAFDEELNSWIPELGWIHLNCTGEPRQGSSNLYLDTANDDHFN